MDGLGVNKTKFAGILKPTSYVHYSSPNAGVV